MSSSSRKFVGSVKLHAAFAAGLFALGANADGIVDEIKPDDALEFEARQTENGYLYVDELGRTNAVEIFLSSGSWTIPSGVTAFDYFVVGGGGSGAARYGGGGGAGGVITGTIVVMDNFDSRELTIDVGAGGAAVMGANIGKKGGPSSISATIDSELVALVEALGGGGGLNSSNGTATDIHGGSGGGGSYNVLPGGRADAGRVYSAFWITGEMFANKGGLGTGNTDFKGGGGGGAGEKGASFVDGGKGGDGIETFITGKSAWFAGGGGGARNAAATGGKGGGGAGCIVDSVTPVNSALAENGKPNTGSGGGGEDDGATSGAGGDGIVIIRHRVVTDRTEPAPQHELTVKASKGGRVSGMGPGCYDEDSTVILVAEPTADYEFGNWTVDGVSISQSSVLVLEMTSDMTVVANFDELPKSYEWGWYDARDRKTAIVAFTNESIGAISWMLPEGVKAFDYVVVGGGGSGGSRYGGGGGAGGVITGTVSSVKGFTSRELLITVGAGGAPVTGQSVGNAGSPSEIVATVGSEEVSLVRALGGGAGLNSNNSSAKEIHGGSGGGGSYYKYAGGKADAGNFYLADWITGEKFANEGGLGTDKADYKGGGGGGAGEAGATFDNGAKGGDGIETFITGKSLWLAGGGGGANGDGANTAPGGKGGGGSSAGSMAAESAVPNTGSGGGGLGLNGNYYSGAGGSGIVILRYALPSSGLILILR